MHVPKEWAGAAGADGHQMLLIEWVGVAHVAGHQKFQVLRELVGDLLESVQSLMLDIRPFEDGMAFCLCFLYVY